ncbi:MAG: DUF4402 domain-containing protein [Phenylobacterium sp.]
MTQVRRLILGALGAVLVTGAASQACAQNSSQQTTSSSTTIFQPIALAKNTDLSFGTVVRPSTGTGTVVIAAATGARTLTGAGALLATGPNAVASRATYTVSGEGGQSYAITVPASFSMTRSTGGQTILVTLASTATTGILSGSLGAAGTGTFGVGGSIPLADTTVSGAYTGTFNVVVAYN